MQCKLLKPLIFILLICIQA